MLNPKSQTNPKQIPNLNFQNSKPISFGHCNFGHWLLFGIWCLALGILMSGCATLWEGAKGVVGISTKELEDNRKTAISKILPYDYFSCYTQALDTLKHGGHYIYAEDIKRHLIAIYISEEDTTPVGIFFKEIDARNTQVEVSSASTYAKEFIASRLFPVLEEPPQGIEEQNITVK